MAPHPDLAALAAALQETARALLVLDPHTPPAKPEEPPAAPPVPRDGGETRVYYFPPSTLNQERELLREYRTEDLLGLLEVVHSLLAGLVEVMRNVNTDVRVRGHVIAGLGRQLHNASSLVLRMRNVYGKVMPVRG